MFYKRASYRFEIAFHFSATLGGSVGIAGGALIFVAGALGIASYKDPQNHGKNVFHMVFSILACCASALGISCFIVGVL